MKEVIILKKKIDNEGFYSTIFQPFQFELELKKTCGNENHEKETKHIYASADDLLHIRIGNLNWCKNKGREIVCLCCKEIEVDAVLIDPAKIPQRKKSISLFSFYGNCLTTTMRVTPMYLVD